MSMKTLKIALLFPTLLLAGCIKNKFLSRPEDTNLEFWITERPTSDEINAKGCTYIPGCFGCSIFLGSKYSQIEVDGKLVLPETYVMYTLTGYPDLIDRSAITGINIKDPSIYVYGLTIESSIEEITNRMLSLKFKKGETENLANGETYYYFHKNNCTFSFSSGRIGIGAHSTNKYGIIY